MIFVASNGKQCLGEPVFVRPFALTATSHQVITRFISNEGGAALGHFPHFLAVVQSSAFRFVCGHFSAPASIASSCRAKRSARRHQPCAQRSPYTACTATAANPFTPHPPPILTSSFGHRELRGLPVASQPPSRPSRPQQPPAQPAPPPSPPSPAPARPTRRGPRRGRPPQPRRPPGRTPPRPCQPQTADPPPGPWAPVRRQPLPAALLRRCLGPSWSCDTGAFQQGGTTVFLAFSCFFASFDFGEIRVFCGFFLAIFDFC